MTRHGRPRQPGSGEDLTDPPVDPAGPGPAGEPAADPGAGHARDAPVDVPAGTGPARDGPVPPSAGEPPPEVRIGVRGGSKVSLLAAEGADGADDAPAAGGRPGARHPRRRQGSARRAPAASGTPTASGTPAADAAEHGGSTAVGASGDRPGDRSGGASVVAFPGAPSSRRRRRRLLAALAAVVALAVFAAAVFLSPLFAVRDIDVRGAQLVEPTRVESALEPYLGVPLTRIAKAEVRESVGEIPQVRSLEVLLEPPHRLVVELQERVPVAVVEDGGEYAVVDSDGVQVATAATAEEAGVPVVTGGRQVLETRRFDVIADVLAALPESVLAQLRTASAESLSSVELVFTDGRRVVWGTAEHSDLKAQVLRELVEARGPASGVETYDVSSPTRPVIR